MIFNILLSDYLLLVDTNSINSVLLVCIGFGGLFVQMGATLNFWAPVIPLLLSPGCYMHTPLCPASNVIHLSMQALFTSAV